MALFLIQRECTLPPSEVWRRLTDWEWHEKWVPLTTVRVAQRSPTGGLGTLFVASTGLGPFRFQDPMEVVRWHPPTSGLPAHCRVEKRGSVVRGWTEIEVNPRDGGSSVRWRQELRLAGLLHVFDPLTRLGGRLMYGRVIKGLLAAQRAE